MQNFEETPGKNTKEKLKSAPCLFPAAAAANVSMPTASPEEVERYVDDETLCLASITSRSLCY